MTNQSNLHFLQERIKELQSALFFSLHDSVLKFSTSLVNILKVDEFGQVWFMVHRPAQALQEFDREFPAKLDFFKKGMPYYLNITGKAYIVSDPEEINTIVSEDIRRGTPAGMVLIKVKMMKADYFETPQHAESGWWKEVRQQAYSWLFNTRPGYKPYHLEPQPYFESQPRLAFLS